MPTKLPEDGYSFTESELKAISLLFQIGRSDWIKPEVLAEMSRYHAHKEIKNAYRSVLVHCKKVIGRFPSRIQPRT